MSDPSNRIKKAEQEEIQRQIDEFLARGGKVKKYKLGDTSFNFGKQDTKKTHKNVMKENFQNE